MKSKQPAFPQDDIHLVIPKELSEKYPELLQQIKVRGKGMTLRQYYAAKAMQGILTTIPHMPNDDIVRQSFNIADAMIEFEEKEGKK